MALGEFLQDKVVADLEEGGEGLLACDPCPQVVIVVVETTQDIEHEDPVSHWVPEVAKSIRLSLRLPAELAHGKIALLKGAEIRIKLESPSLGVAEELALECQPSLVHGAAMSPDDVLQI